MLISGEKFQSLAEISFCSEISEIIQNQINNKHQNLHIIQDFNVEDISKYKRIFIYTQYIENFFNKFFNFLKDNTVIISHNSDIGIHNNSHRYLEANNIKAWFCQNRESTHPKLFSIPIGLANSQWQHGNQDLILSIREENNQKEYLVYKNFDINTNYGERYMAHINTQQNGIELSSNIDIESYWRIVSKSYFTISPPGGGIDCHRIWESLYLRTIPVVKYHESFSQFKHLPILFIERWEDLTPAFLRCKSEEFKSVDFDKISELTIEHWQNKINSF